MRVGYLTHLTLADALDYSASVSAGMSNLRSSSNREVESLPPYFVTTGASIAWEAARALRRLSSHAVIDAPWSEARAKQLGTCMEALREHSADQVQALAARRVMGRPEVR